MSLPSGAGSRPTRPRTRRTITNATVRTTMTARPATNVSALATTLTLNRHPTGLNRRDLLQPPHVRFDVDPVCGERLEVTTHRRRNSTLRHDIVVALTGRRWDS